MTWAELKEGGEAEEERESDRGEREGGWEGGREREWGREREQLRDRCESWASHFPFLAVPGEAKHTNTTSTSKTFKMLLCALQCTHCMLFSTELLQHW